MGGKNCQYSTDKNYGHIEIIKDMADAVLNDHAPMITGEEAKKSVEIILAIYESSRLNKEIILE